MTGLEVRIRRKVYAGSAPVLEDLRFAAAPGEFVAIVGPSGAGKSTLLNVVGGLDRQLEGEVYFNETLLSAEETPAAHIGFIFQAPRLMPWLTALDNIRLVLAGKVVDTEVARRLLRDVGLEDCEDRYPGQLSGGMQRRVALARAFAVRPALLLMDEPFVSLDAPTAARLRQLLMTLWAELRPTVLFVTHDLREALALADRVLFLSDSPGKVVLEVPVELSRPRELEDPQVGALYQRLLTTHPDLLSGLTASAEGSTPDEEGKRQTA